MLGEWITVEIPRIPLMDDLFFHPWDLVACSPDFGLWLWQEPYLEDTLWTWRRTYWQQSFRGRIPDGFLLLYLLGGSTGDPEQTLQFWEVLETIRGCRTDADHWFLLGWVPHIRGLNWGAWRNSLDTRDSLVSMDWILWWNYTLLTLWCLMNRWRSSALLHPCSITS